MPHAEQPCGCESRRAVAVVARTDSRSDAVVPGKVKAREV